MTYAEGLVARAAMYWESAEPLPLDLFAAMRGEGLDVNTLESQHTN